MKIDRPECFVRNDFSYVRRVRYYSNASNTLRPIITNRTFVTQRTYLYTFFFVIVINNVINNTFLKSIFPERIIILASIFVGELKRTFRLVRLERGQSSGPANLFNRTVFGQVRSHSARPGVVSRLKKRTASSFVLHLITSIGTLFNISVEDFNN